MRVLLSASLLLSCALFVVDCGKKKSENVKPTKVGAPIEAKTFEPFISNENVKPGQKNHFVKSLKNSYIPLGNYGADNKKILAATAVLFLHPDHKYDLFVDALMMHKFNDGTFCRDTNGEFLTKRVGKRSFPGTWTQKKKSLTLSDLGTVTLINTPSGPGINIQFAKAEILKDFSEKAHDLVPVDDTEKGFNYFKYEKGEVLDPAVAKTQLDDACKNQAGVTADDANSNVTLKPGEAGKPPVQNPQANNGEGILGDAKNTPAPAASPNPSPSPTQTEQVPIPQSN